MNLFKLVGSIFIDNEEANKSISKTDSHAESLTQKFIRGVGEAVKWGAGIATAAAGMATAVGAAVVKVAEDTREYRNEMGKLETAFEASNHSADAAKSTYQGLQAILGDTGQAAEAAGFLAELCDTEEQLAKWTDICTGVYGKFNVSIPIEGLTEAANETAKTGVVTGNLADALNWAAKEGETFGVKLKANTEKNKEWNEAVKSAASAEDYFNLALQACSSEQERQTLITETLNGMYSESATLYRENNKAVLEANAAQERLNSVMAQLGEIAEPVVSKVKFFGAILLENAMPAVMYFTEKGERLIDTFLAGESPIQLFTDKIKDLQSWFISTSSYAEEKMQPILSDLEPIFRFLQDAVTSLAGGFLEYVTSGELTTDVTEAITGAIDFLSNAYQTAKSFVDAFVDGLPDYVTNGEMVRDITNEIKDAVEFLREKYEAVKEAVQPYIDALSEYVTSGEAAEDITYAVETAVEFLYEAYQFATDKIAALIQGFKDAVQWTKEHKTQLSVAAIAVGALTTAVLVYNRALIAQKATQLAKIALDKAETAQIWLMVAADDALKVAKNAATVATNALGTAMKFATSKTTLIIAGIAAVIAIGVALYQNWDTVKAKCTEFANSISKKFTEIKDNVVKKVNEIKNSATEKFQSLKNSIGTIMQAANDTVSQKLTNMKKAYQDHGGGIKGIAAAAMEGVKGYYTAGYTFIDNLTGGKLTEIKNKFTKTMNGVRDVVKTAIDKVKGFFNFSVSLPKIKLPHFSIKPKDWELGDLLKGSIPKLGIEWYKKAYDNAMLLDKPTIFGYDETSGKLLGGGDGNGSEVVAGSHTLMGMIQTAVSAQNDVLATLLFKILDAIIALDEHMGGNLREALAGTAFEINKREFARLVKAVT